MGTELTEVTPTPARRGRTPPLPRTRRPRQVEMETNFREDYSFTITEKAPVSVLVESAFTFKTL